jgi:DNA-binding MarR family transcriptional regulator
MPIRLPLPTLLSQVLVAFTIEFDNEAEHRMPHRTTATGGAGAPRGATWLVSQVMWSNVLQFVGPEGVRVGELHARARTRRDSLVGLQRWGYVTVGPGPGHGGGSPKDDRMVRPTAAGLRARGVWAPLVEVIEERWRGRFGPDAVDGLRSSLERVVGHLDVELPRYLPVVHPGQNGRAELTLVQGAVPTADDQHAHDLDLSALLSQALLAFTLDFERQSKLSLPICANTLRVLGGTGVRVRDLPRLTGVSKAANSVSVGFLERIGCAVVEPDPAATRRKVVRLTPKGTKAQTKYRRVLAQTEEYWRERFGHGSIAERHASLERLVDAGSTTPPSTLLRGLQPYPEGWRASVRPPELLPHYPMVLHRGGFPDGS